MTIEALLVEMYTQTSAARRAGMCVMRAASEAAIRKAPVTRSAPAEISALTASMQRDLVQHLLRGAE